MTDHAYHESVTDVVDFDIDIKHLAPSIAMDVDGFRVRAAAVNQALEILAVQRSFESHRHPLPLPPAEAA